MFQGDNGENSSKRIIGFIVVVWVMFCSTAYMVNIQLDGKESASTDNILITVCCGAFAMLTGGVIEKFGKK